jgi:hypothetical protein
MNVRLASVRLRDRSSLRHIRWSSRSQGGSRIWETAGERNRIERARRERAFCFVADWVLLPRARLALRDWVYRPIRGHPALGHGAHTAPPADLAPDPSLINLRRFGVPRRPASRAGAAAPGCRCSLPAALVGGLTEDGGLDGGMAGLAEGGVRVTSG